MSFGCRGTRPVDLGTTEGLFKSCPSSPNCVSSQAQDAEHRMDPIQVSGDPTAEFRRLTDLVRAMDRVEVIESTPEYLRAEFTSLVFRFVDDVEFYLDVTARQIDFRSASRLGYRDFGANRKRIEAIKAKLAISQGGHGS